MPTLFYQGIPLKKKSVWIYILFIITIALVNRVQADDPEETINHAPQAVDDSVSTINTEPISISVLNNDSDLDNDMLSLVSYDNPQNGQIELLGETFKYTPNPYFTGIDSFTYTISDGSFSEAKATARSTAIAAFLPDGVLTESNTYTFSITDGQGSNAVASADGTATIFRKSEDFPENTETLSFTISNAEDGVAIATAKACVLVASENATAKATATAVAIYTPTENHTNSETFAFTLTQNEGEANASAQAMANIIYTLEDNSFKYTILDSNNEEVTATIMAIAIATVSATIKVMTVDTATVNINVHSAVQDTTTTAHSHNIPTLSEWVLIILTLSLMLVGKREPNIKEK